MTFTSNNFIFKIFARFQLEKIGQNSTFEENFAFIIRQIFIIFSLYHGEKFLLAKFWRKIQFFSPLFLLFQSITISRVGALYPIRFLPRVGALLLTVATGQSPFDLGEKSLPFFTRDRNRVFWREKKKPKMAMAAQTLDFSVCQEVRGAMHDGRLRMTTQTINFKDTTTGRVSSIFEFQSFYFYMLSNISLYIWT